MKLVQAGTESSQIPPDEVLISVDVSLKRVGGVKTQLSVSRQDLLELARVLGFDAAKQTWFESIRHITIQDTKSPFQPLPGEQLYLG
jgi:hypothetical protein